MMKRVLLIGLLALLSVSLTMAVPSYSRAHGGWGAGWFIGGLALGSALGFASRPYYYYPPPAYVYPAAGLCLSRAGPIPTRPATSTRRRRPPRLRSLLRQAQPAKASG